MQQNPCHIKYILVHGRRSEFEGNIIRRGLIRARENYDFHIISYDSLAEALHTKTPLYLGIRKNEHFELVSKQFVSENIFFWVDPTYLRISDELRKDALAKRSTWHLSRKPGVLFMDDVLPHIGRCDA
jgi:hypothetical protein